MKIEDFHEAVKVVSQAPTSPLPPPGKQAKILHPHACALGIPAVPKGDVK